MNKNENRGITLIALVITIIIMLILAGVTIGLVFNGDLIRYAKTAKTNTQEQIEGEQLLASGIINGKTIEDYVRGTGASSGVQVGSVIQYNCIEGVDPSLLTYTSEQNKNGDSQQIFTVTENPAWVVLEIGANGEMLITPRDPVQSLTLYGQEGYQYGPEEIEAICEMYGHGEGATGGRSITIEDVNRISGYTPVEPETHTYKKEESGYISYDNGGQKWYTDFNYYDNNEWKRLNTGESATLQHTYYDYSLGASLAESVLSNGNGYYWLPSRCVFCDAIGRAYLRVRRVYGSSIGSGTLYGSNGSSNDYSLAVRPVVSVQSDIIAKSDYNSNDYIIAAYNNSNEIINDQYFIVDGGERATFLFRNFTDVNISTAEDMDSITATSWEDFNENSTARCGYLCDSQGNILMGNQIMDGEAVIDAPIRIELTDVQSDSYRAYETYMETNEYITYREFLENNNIENNRIGTEIDETGRIYAKYSNGIKNLIGKVAITGRFNIPNSLEMIEENLFKDNPSGSEIYDGIACIYENVTIKKIDLNTANK